MMCRKVDLLVNLILGSDVLRFRRSIDVVLDVVVSAIVYHNNDVARVVYVNVLSVCSTA